MQIRPSLCRFTAWLAAMALLLGSMLPVVSHSVVAAPAPDQGWVEVCTVSGMAWVKSVDEAPASGGVAAANGGSQHPMPGGTTLDGCGWCGAHSPTAGLPALAPSFLGPFALAARGPAAAPNAPRLRAVWASAQSRAPPAAA